ncbi:4250_t:CDS:2, partial [Rhizophagus irregularis]
NYEIKSKILQNNVQKPSKKLGRSYDPAIVEQGWYDWWDHKGMLN